MVGIVSNNAALSAQRNLKVSADQSSASIARLSSGNKIIRASDDVAGLAVGTVLRTNVSTLRTALTSTSQASSLLQIADGGLQNIGEILQRQKALAVSANSGSLSNNERAFLNEEFQNLTNEINRLVDGTNFNGIKLLDGALFNKSDVTTATDAGVQATGSINFSAVAADGDTVSINGVQFTFSVTPAATTDVAIGGSASDSVDNLINAINATIASSATSSANRNALLAVSVEKVGSSLMIRSNSAGLEGNRITLAEVGAGITVSGTTLTGGVEGNLTTTRTSVIGSVGDNILRQASGTRASGTIQMTTIAANAEQITVNGVQFTFLDTANLTGAANEVEIGGSIAATITNLVSAINNSNSDGAKKVVATASAADTVTVTADAVGTDGNNIVFFSAATTPASFTVSNTGTMTGGQSVSDIGGTKAYGTYTYTSQVTAGNSITVGGVAFTYRDSTTYTGSSTEILIGDTVQDTIDNTVAALSNAKGNLSAANALALGVASYERSGDVLNITYDAVGSNGNAFTTTAVGTAMTVSGGTLTDSTTPTIAIDTTNISNNDAFVGKLSGFKATYNGVADKVTLEIKVGDYTYKGTIDDTTPRNGTTVRLTSEQSGGGYFEFDLAGGNGSAVANQSDADALAGRLDRAFSTLTFGQSRDVSSFKAEGDVLTNGVKTGSLTGASLDIKASGFSDVKIESVKVTAPVAGASDGVIEMVINGETFRSKDGLGTSTIGFTLVSQTNPRNTVTFQGAESTSFSNAAEAASFQAALEGALGVGEGKSGLNFQVGITASDSINVALQDARTSALYKDASGATVTLNISTAEGAQAASDVLDNAIRTVTSLRATVGALQSRFNYAAASLETSVQNTDAARGDFLDASIEAESTNFAQSQVRLQASISVLAQANQLPQNLLKLIG